MSGQDSYLLVDMGNTCVKYGFYSATKGLADIRTADSVAELTSDLANCARVLLSCVANDESVIQCRELCKELNTDLFVAKTEAETFGFRCAYSRYKTLGVDRWLAMLAARSLSHKAFAVIDIGTAMTCDIGLNNQHLGGWILPGYDLMRTSLISNTARVFSDGNRPTVLTLGKETEDCVNLGCLAAIQGAVLMAKEQLRQRTDEFDIFLTGGGQSLVKELQDSDIRFENNLVLTGLSLFID